MQRYIVRRLIALPVIILVVSLVTFFLMRSPLSGDPAVTIAGQNATADQVAAVRKDLGLDRQIVVQFGDWLAHLARGDFGRTFRGKQLVWPEVKRRMPVTFEIVGLTLVFGTVFGLLSGVIAAARYDTPLDYGLRVFAVFGQSIPSFFLLILLIVLPSLWFNYAPPSGSGTSSLFHHPWLNLRLFVPPALMLSMAHTAGMLRLTRSTLLDALRQDYVRTAHAKGLRERVVVVRHGLRNALIPIITVLGGRIAELFFGALILERVFSINGLGQFFFQSVLERDFPVVQFLVVYTATIIVLINLAVDLSYTAIDLRVRYR